MLKKLSVFIEFYYSSLTIVELNHGHNYVRQILG